jgi:hypothetical protein
MSRAGTEQLGAMIAWEQGELDEVETVQLFQGLVDSGLAWKLQGMYGRQASRLIEAGLVHPPGHPTLH